MWELDYKESWVPKNWCFWSVVLEKTLESPLDCKEIQPVSPKENQSWILIGRTDRCWTWNSTTFATWCEELTHRKRPWCWERLMAGGEGDDRGWDGWMVSPTQRTWVWASSGPPLYILASFVKDKVSTGAWIYLRAFYFVPLIYFCLCDSTILF